MADAVRINEGEVVFMSVVRFFCDIDDVVRRAETGEVWGYFLMHGRVLVSLRRARRMDSPFVAQIETSLLHIRVAVREIQARQARYAYRLAMSYLRAVQAEPDLAHFLATHTSRTDLGETFGDRMVMQDNAEIQLRRAQRRNMDADIFDPLSSSESGSDSEHGSDF
jgi:hypothetical protein